jgi:membrane-associated phospholipid phosphatase
VVGGTGLGVAGTAFAQSESKPRRGCETKPASFTQLFTGTVKNFKGVPSHTNAQLLTVGTLAAFGARPVDKHVSDSFSSSGLHETFEAGRVVGGTPAQLGAAFLTYGLGRALGKPCAASLGADLIQAQLLAEGLSTGLKWAVGRTRPDGSARSFPSGHTTVSFASATVLQKHYGWKAGLPAYAIASYVAASRVQTKRHYLSDVAFGAALGIVAGRTVTIGGRHKFAVSPLVSPDGAGIGLSWVAKK